MKLCPSRGGLAALILLAPSFAHGQEAFGGKSLASYRDKNRVLLVFALSEKDAGYQEQTRLWQGEKAGFADRQLVVLPVLADAKQGRGDAPGTLAKWFDVDPKSFRVILIGKDGHDAYRSDKPVKADALYLRIDAMPMRREEMRRKPGHGQKEDAAKSLPGATPPEI